MKKLFYLFFCDNPVIRLVNHPVLGIAVPSFAGLYYVTLDIWGNDWELITKYKDIHEFFFSALAILTILILLLKTISELLRGRIDEKHNGLTKAILKLFNNLLKKKRDRFFNKARELSPNEDVFRLITHPKEQLIHALDETKNFLIDGLGINSRNIGITIIQCNPHDKMWSYLLKCDHQRQHTEAHVLMTSGSTAAYCFKQGSSILIPDIRKGIKEGIFMKSERSENGKIGSIFCNPVRITVGNHEYFYIFTIAIFGQNVCSTADEDDCMAHEKVFNEIADRVELELYLYSMKQYRYMDATKSREDRQHAENTNV